MIVPEKLKTGDEIRVVALARSLALIWETNTQKAKENLEKRWFKVTFWKHVLEKDEFYSSSVQSRIEDFHDALRDTNIKAILTVIWWYNTNQLLEYIDYDLIKSNPKIICWFSDITVITNAITAKTWMITYSWLHFSTWAMEKWFDYNEEYFTKCLMQSDPFTIEHSLTWSDDPWYIDQENRNFIPDKEFRQLVNGSGEWRIVWGNIRWLACLQWTQYMPDLTDTILFLEEVAETNWPLFDSLLQSLIHQPNFSWVKWILIGRFQKGSWVTKELLQKIVYSKPQLSKIPVIANVDFGHTNPLITFPIWWSVNISSWPQGVEIKIYSH